MEQGPHSPKLTSKEIFFKAKHTRRLRKLYAPLDREIPLTGKFDLEARLLKTLLTINYQLWSIIVLKNRGRHYFKLELQCLFFLFFLANTDFLVAITVILQNPLAAFVPINQALLSTDKQRF